MDTLAPELQTPATPSIPEGICLYAIGDVHGARDRLEQLVATIALDARNHPISSKRLVFLGDYIGRGTDSFGVIEFLIANLPADFETIFLRGNHEDAALRIIAGEKELIPGWVEFGGDAYFASYGIPTDRPETTHAPEVLREELLRALPDTHLAFMKQAIYSHVCGDYYFTHAGVKPGVPLERQTADDLLWIREEFLNDSRAYGKIIVHGHNITAEPDIRPNRIGIDTGAYASGHLTCLKLIGTQRRFITT